MTASAAAATSPSMRRAPLLSAEAVAFGYPQRPAFLQDVSLDIAGGQCWGVVGPNGAGKSTLLRLLAGLRRPDAGRILLDGRPLSELPPRERARQIAFLPQHLPTDSPVTARETVLMGRFPHRRLGLFDAAADFEIADRALRTTETAAFAHRPMSTLSGGEAQRVHLAAALAQQPRLLLLDEPTAALDLYHQLSLFSVLRDLAERDGLAVVVVTHDLNLAGRFCSHLLLLDEGRSVAAGPPSDVLRPDILEPVYDVELLAGRDLTELLAGLSDAEGAAAGAMQKQLEEAGPSCPWIFPLRPKKAGDEAASGGAP